MPLNPAQGRQRTPDYSNVRLDTVTEPKRELYLPALYVVERWTPDPNRDDATHACL